jgi:spore maturation protein SpmA
MVLNYIWVAFFVIAFVVALLKLIVTGDTEVFKTIIDATFSSSKMAVVDISLPLIGVMTLWLGLMNIGEKAGAINFLSRIVGPFFNKLFPEIPKNHPASGQIMMNFSANMLGLDNAATPLGLKAMNSMQELNPNKDTASNAQIMFLVLNTSGLTIIPVTILAQRAIMGAANPSDVFIPILIATFFSTIIGLLTVAIWQKIDLLNAVVISWLTGISAIIFGIIWYFSTLDSEAISRISTVSANLILLTIIVSFMLGALRKKVNVYDAFIDGAKSGFDTAVKVIPYLVAMLVGIAVFRASGAMDYLVNGIGYLVGAYCLYETIKWQRCKSNDVGRYERWQCRYLCWAFILRISRCCRYYLLYCCLVLWFGRCEENTLCGNGWFNSRFGWCCCCNIYFLFVFSLGVGLLIYVCVLF